MVECWLDGFDAIAISSHRGSLSWAAAFAAVTVLVEPAFCMPITSVVADLDAMGILAQIELRRHAGDKLPGTTACVVGSSRDRTSILCSPERSRVRIRGPPPSRGKDPGSRVCLALPIHAPRGVAVRSERMRSAGKQSVAFDSSNGLQSKPRMR